MLDFFYFGRVFVESLSTVGNWLLTSPKDGANFLNRLLTAFFEYFDFGILEDAYFSVIQPWLDLEGASYGQRLFGAGLILLLSVRLIKYFTDILT